ncbi:hypothetical protein R1flu_011219 [Riccia fluitans]|uniref:Uncharacterized protein n=1 Tax=Riccia fluitans TaxID=41844 RepID=A0ABD1Z777_9MARC
MERSVSLPNTSYISNGDSHQPHLKAARSLGASPSLHRKRVSWVPDIMDNEDVTKKSFKKEPYVSSVVLSSTNWDEFDREDPSL